MVKLRAKICLLGDPTTGKTSLIKKYISHTHPTQYAMTLNANIDVHTEYLPNTDANAHKPKLGEKPKLYLEEDKSHAVEFLFYDIAGNEIFEDQLEQYLSNLNYFIIVYDVTNPNSFTSIPKYLRIVKKVAEQMKRRQLSGILVANKTDLKQMEKISPQEGMQFAQKNGLQFFSTSAATSDVAEIFQHVAKDYFQRYNDKVENVKFLSENKQW